MIILFKPVERHAYAPKISPIEAEINEQLSGLEGAVIFIKRLSRERIFAATTKKLYLLSVGRRIHIERELERPKGATLIDVTPRRIVFGREQDVLVTDLEGKRLFEIPLHQQPVAIAAYRDTIAIAFEGRIDIFQDEIKRGTLNVLNATVMRIIKHRKRGALVVGSSLGRVTVIDLNNMRKLASYRLFNEPVKHLAALSDGHTVTVIAGSTRRAAVIDTYRRRVQLNVERVDAVAIGEGVVLVASNNVIHRFTYGGRRISSIVAHAERITAMDMRPTLVTATEFGGVTVWSGRKRLGKHVVHIAGGETFFGYVNDGRLFRYSPGRRAKFMTSGVVLDLDIAPGKMGVFATPANVQEVVGTRTRYVVEERYDLVAESKRVIAVARGNEVLYVMGKHKRKIELPARVSSIRVRDLGNSTILIVASDKVYGYRLSEKGHRLMRTIDERAKDVDAIMHTGRLIVATAGRYVTLRDATREPKRIVTIMKPAENVELRRSKDRLLLAFSGEETMLRDITELEAAAGIALDHAVDVAIIPGYIALATYGLKLYEHRGTERKAVKISYGLTADVRLEGYTDVSSFTADPVRTLLEAKRNGTLGKLLNSLIDRGLASLRGNIVIINVSPKKTEGLEVFYQRIASNSSTIVFLSSNLASTSLTSSYPFIIAAAYATAKGRNVPRT